MKLLLLTALILSVLSCNKSPVCETWEYSEECKSTDPYVVGCNGSVSYFTEKLCDKDLEKAKAGTDQVFYDDGKGVKKIRHYIKRVQ